MAKVESGPPAGMGRSGSQGGVVKTVLSILRSIVAVAAGALTVLIVVFGTILLVVPMPFS